MAALFKISRVPTEEEYLSSPYLYVAKTENLSYIRSLSVAELLYYKGDDLPPHILHFLRQNENVVVMADIWSKWIVQLRLRSFRGKYMTVYRNSPIPFFGMGYLPPSFKYGDALVLVEGILDAESIRTMYPYVVSVTTSSLSVYQIHVLKTLTSRIVLCLDQDDSGIQGTRKAYYQLKKNGFHADVCQLPSKIKDPGQLIEWKMKGWDYQWQNASRLLKQNLLLLTQPSQ